ncbi:hypothetical protein [Acanthopleuribacter pedis]|uniref:Uncharacterized protein n=1 Tax=Acanthopleuribacter pedis TaxID=442870 RepID=A0A8J7U189_9BACT|nr:hypothetical protein [Acanthopleuribacter pedis]MBO1317267.1 hypothetical protein [Acanthopleuribacter pedis]MBO1318574.1 hypothetical protein [Acanthopleuribacter pedis]
MLTYEQRDAVADAVFPTLALIALFHIGQALAHKRWPLFGFGLAGAVYGMFTAYGLRYLDILWPHWHRLGLDYSTHTAVVLVTVTLITLMTQKQRWVWPLIAGAYAGLMLYQAYHPLIDIVTTTLVVGFFFWPPVFFLYRWQATPPSAKANGQKPPGSVAGLT